MNCMILYQVPMHLKQGYVHLFMKWYIIVIQPLLYILARVLRILLATDFSFSGPSKTLIMLCHVTGVGALSNQLCNILDILTWLDKLEVCNPSIMSESTPSRSPISCHLALTELSNVNNVCFSGLVAKMNITNNKYYIFYLYYYIFIPSSKSKSTSLAVTIIYNK